MGVHAARRTSAREAEPLVDVLVIGPEEPPWRPSPGRRRAGVAGLALAVLAVLAALVPAQLSGTGPQDAASVELVLPEDRVPVPRREAPPVADRVHGGVHVELVNEGGAPVRVLSAALSPGRWLAAVVDDLAPAADPRGWGRLLRPSWRAVLVLHRSVLCTPGADHGPAPTQLAVAVEVDGRERTHTLPVGRGQRAYGGGLPGLLGAPERFCVPDSSRAAAATSGDPAGPFLELWPPWTDVLPAR